MINNHQKNCGRCNIIKNITEFYKNKQQKSGFSSYCKSCEQEKQKNYRIKNKEKIKIKRASYHILNKEKENIYSKNYNKLNKEKTKSYYKEYNLKNAETINKKKQEYHNLNKEKINKNKKQYYQINKEIKNKKSKEYYQLNKNEINKRRLKKHQERLKTDEIYKIKITIRQLIRDSLKRKNSQKSQKTINILGCNLIFFKQYIENKFDKNMTWDNYGTYWWFDHIKPLSSAKTTEDILNLNHYTNFQPMFWKDNIKKSNKF